MKAKTKTFENQIESGNIKSVEDKILEQLEYANMTKDALSTFIGVKVSTIVARLSDLYDKGLIKVEREIKNEKGNWTSVYELSKEEEVEKIKAKRKAGKILRYSKYLRENGYNVTMKF